MKIAIIYYSKTGNTRAMAEVVAEGVRNLPGIETGVFPLEQINMAFVKQSRAVIFGTPTHHADICWQFKQWFDEISGHPKDGRTTYPLADKLGAAFATSDFAQGGSHVALANLLGHMLVQGMVVYSGGAVHGLPYIPYEAVSLTENFEISKPIFRTFGERIAIKAKELFGDAVDQRLPQHPHPRLR